jgi:hypothetical protein
MIPDPNSPGAIAVACPQCKSPLRPVPNLPLARCDNGHDYGQEDFFRIKGEQILQGLRAALLDNPNGRGVYVHYNVRKIPLRKVSNFGVLDGKPDQQPNKGDTVVAAAGHASLNVTAGDRFTFVSADMEGSEPVYVVKRGKAKPIKVPDTYFMHGVKRSPSDIALLTKSLEK